MKTLKLKTGIGILAVLFLTPFAAAANFKINNKTKDAETCLEVSGRVNVGLITKGIFKVLLLLDNNVVDSVNVAAGSNFKFYLTRDMHYTVRIIKESYITRSISFDTHLPDGVDPKPLFRFHFDTVLQKANLINNDSDIYDFPIAIISYNKNKGLFDYSKKYTTLVKREMSMDASQ